MTCSVSDVIEFSTNQKLVKFFKCFDNLNAIFCILFKNVSVFFQVVLVG